MTSIYLDKNSFTLLEKKGPDSTKTRGHLGVFGEKKLKMITSNLEQLMIMLQNLLQGTLVRDSLTFLIMKTQMCSFLKKITYWLQVMKEHANELGKFRIERLINGKTAI